MFDYARFATFAISYGFMYMLFSFSEIGSVIQGCLGDVAERIASNYLPITI